MTVKITFTWHGELNLYKTTDINISFKLYTYNFRDMWLRIYKKKSDILVSLGKASDDTRYLDRALDRGEVVKLEINGVESFAEYKEVERYFLEILIGEIELLKAGVENFSDNSEELEEAKINMEYYKNEAEEERDKRVALESVLDGLREKGISIGYGE